jgi:hypothetical protein
MDLRLVLSLDTTNPLKLLRSNLSILQQTGKGINIAGCLVLEQSNRGIEKEEEKFLIDYRYHRYYYNGDYVVPPDNCINILHEFS